jgi:hypothetical protein
MMARAKRRSIISIFPEVGSISFSNPLVVAKVLIDQKRVSPKTIPKTVSVDI